MAVDCEGFKYKIDAPFLLYVFPAGVEQNQTLVRSTKISFLWLFT